MFPLLYVGLSCVRDDYDLILLDGTPTLGIIPLNIVFASDFKNDNKETYHQATTFAKAFNAKIHLLLVNTPNNFKTTQKATDSINNFICDHNFEDFTLNIYNDDTVEKGIVNFSKDIDADLIGISTHGRQGIAHFFNGSISEDLVNHAKRPVITFKI